MDLKRKIMSRKRKTGIPLWAFPVLAAAICISAFYMPCKSAAAEKILYIGALSAMPEAAVDKAKNAGRDMLSFFVKKTDENTQKLMQQKIGDLTDNEEEGLGNTTDLSVTPMDIMKSMAAVQQSFDDGIYKEDGVVSERTFTDDQATDSYQNIHVRNVTAGQTVDIENMLKDDFDMEIEDYAEPTVLIYHTHSTETYIMNDNGKFSSSYPARNDDKSVNMIRIGDEITRILQARGIGVIHDRTIYDTVYTGAYAKSRAGIEKNLKKYPSVKITLDIHRDAVYYDDYTHMKPVTEIDGEKAAQMMIITGAEGGSVTDFPKWKTNLAFALHLQKTVNDRYENLMKPIYFCNRKYNMDITPYSLLIEVGTDANSLKEAAYTGRLLGDSLAQLIKTKGAAAEK